jgi:serine/threonine-protein kinase HipA
MRKAKILVNGTEAGILVEITPGARYIVEYSDGYEGPGISVTMPVKQKKFSFDEFPPFFDGLLPEGFQLEGLLKLKKIDRNDHFSQLIAVGEDMVGVVTVTEIPG